MTYRRAVSLSCLSGGLSRWFTLAALGLLLIYLNAEAVVAAPVVGGAFLASGNKNFPCYKVVKWHKRKDGEVFHASLWRSFGQSTRCYRALFSLPQKVTIEFYLSNEACRRNGNCEAWDLLSSYSVADYNHALEYEKKPAKRAVFERAKAIKSFCGGNKKPGDRCLLTLGLESNFTEAAGRQLSKWLIKAGWNEKDLVYNPTYGYKGADVAHFYERHSLFSTSQTAPGRTIVTLDGYDPSFCYGRFGDNRISADHLRMWWGRHRGEVHYFGAWCANWQGIGTDGTLYPRSKRAFGIYRSELNEFLDL